MAITFLQASETHKHSEVLKSESLYIIKSGRHDPKTSGLLIEEFRAIIFMTLPHILVYISKSFHFISISRNDHSTLNFEVPEDRDLILTSFLLFLFSFIYIHWRLITLQYCSGFWHTLIWISHGSACVPHPESPSHLPPHPIPSQILPHFSMVYT